MATWSSVFASVHTGSVQATQATTETAPTGAGEGLLLEGGRAFDVWVEAESGQTLSGTGLFRGYRWEAALGAWARMPLADTPVPDVAVGQRRVLLASFDIVNQRGRFALMAEGVGVSGGGLTVYFIATRPNGGLL